MIFTILYQDEHLVAIQKPVGFFVHRPEFSPEKVPREKIILHQLRDQLGQRVYPLHRLDVATPGVLFFALNPEAASLLGKQFQENTIRKTYWALVRGHTPDSGIIDLDLESDSSQALLKSLTHYKTLQQLEMPFPVGKKYPTARYSLIEATPYTGRYHQIRRHLNRISHPIVGDRQHGDTHHNRFFTEKLGIPGLCLWAKEIKIFHPYLKKDLIVTSKQPPRWNKILELFKDAEK